MTESVAVNILDMFCKNQLDVDKHLQQLLWVSQVRGRCSCVWGTRRNTGTRRFTKPRNNYNMTLVNIEIRLVELIIKCVRRYRTSRLTCETFGRHFLYTESKPWRSFTTDIDRHLSVLLRSGILCRKTTATCVATAFFFTVLIRTAGSCSSL